MAYHYLDNNYLEQFEELDWESIRLKLYSKTPIEVQRALEKSVMGKRLQLEDFMTLISPAAEASISVMKKMSTQLTQQRFGRTIGMYIPLYLSNLCSNDCTYCGFSMSNRIKRKTLNAAEVESELQAIKAKGYDSILLVTGEQETKVGMTYFRQMIPLAKRYFSYVAMEVQPLDAEQYVELKSLGVDSVLVYQETYHPGVYGEHHLRGKKTDFHYRLDTPDRLGRAGMDKIGIGALLGLNEWRIDSLFTAHHLTYLQKRYWRSRYSVSFPRLRPCAGGVQPKSLISDNQLIQLVCAYRLCFPEVELSLSTREPAELRNQLVKFGITSLSAESSTQPGGYLHPDTELVQFEISDERSTTEVHEMLKAQGIEAVWHDWSIAFSQNSVSRGT
ncbi:2-iminoacetate synthase ThiH [Vibrio porteresiae]|uniref:2-iminoacetate synthase ThiH n=1 Tax=Vibrio porteresiae DSM 19223 TaxID=1123496 RepID=A0ABZ0QD26_9VIBR|nr:2-iminoacetate synthase ThiH [Vibrio porteresiae]WPC74087.1 2-iminoacetate synthase ThiH [Vibrio porteresiae DSM 19223]